MLVAGGAGLWSGYYVTRQLAADAARKQLIIFCVSAAAMTATGATIYVIAQMR